MTRVRRSDREWARPQWAALIALSSQNLVLRQNDGMR
jgi:hypothetical protein